MPSVDQSMLQGIEENFLLLNRFRSSHTAHGSNHRPAAHQTGQTFSNSMVAPAGIRA